MIGFSIEMRENLLKDFLIYTPVEPLQAMSCEEQFEFGYHNWWLLKPITEL